MLFLVPDSKPSAEADVANEPQKEETAAPMNVELDLDDAPFLEELPPDPPAPEPEAVQEKAVAMPAPEKEKKNRFAGLLKNKKLLILAGGGTALLVVALVAVNIFLFPSAETKKEPEKPAAGAAEPRRITVPSTPPPMAAAPALPQFITKWEPFIVPMKGPEGEVVLFNLTLSIPTDNPTLNAEIAQRRVTLRDAVYYYLSKRPLEELMRNDKAQELRSDIVRVLNENLTSGKVESIFVEDYFSEHL